MAIVKFLIILNSIKLGLFLQSDENSKISEAYFLENSLQPSEQDVPIEEFFWTGSGDGPSYSQPKDTSHSSKYPNTVIRTATILATVYIDGNNDFDPLCGFNCDEKSEETGIVESIDDIVSNDPRYWLLTVVAGFFDPQDFPVLEKKLAKLYRIAFLRQQAKHLGFDKAVNSSASANSTQPERRRRSAEIVSPAEDDDVIRTKPFHINQHVYERQILRMRRQKVAPPAAKVQQQPTHPGTYSTFDQRRRITATEDSKNLLRRVNIRIHKLAHGDETGTTGEVDENKIDLTLPSDEKSNSTEIIYSVIVNGKAVLAKTAADDMRLVRMEEVAKIMENDVVLKAEPYLREPTATPLAPSPINGASTFITFVDNPLLITFISIAFVLFILLLLVLLLYGRSKRRLAMEMKRHSTSQDLVRSEEVVDDDIPTVHSGSIEAIGVDNLAFEKESKQTKARRGDIPVIHFPLPPANRPSSEETSGDGTSDSSIYFPKRPYKFNSVQDLLNGNDEERNKIYSKLRGNMGSEKMKRKELGKTTKKQQQTRQRRKRRVGSMEHDVDVHQADEQDNEFDIGRKSQSIAIVEDEKTRRGGGAEAINKDLILQRAGRVNSAESNSIGSYLSMASIRSFPKCIVPEPLSRVLEPVSVTHLDHSDADYETLKNSRLHGSGKSLYISYSEEELKNLKADSDGADPGIVGPAVWEMHKRSRQQSTSNESPLRDPSETRHRFEELLDGAMKLYTSSSYTNCYSLMSEAQAQANETPPGSVKAKENRGKSAATIRLTSRTSGLLSKSDYSRARPLTAEPEALENPIPAIEAWQSKSHSNLMRPFSAGVYHKPKLTIHEEKTAPASAVNRTRAMSASPIIDAIQKELKRISKEEEQKVVDK